MNKPTYEETGEKTRESSLQNGREQYPNQPKPTLSCPPRTKRNEAKRIASLLFELRNDFFLIWINDTDRNLTEPDLTNRLDRTEPTESTAKMVYFFFLLFNQKTETIPTRGKGTRNFLLYVIN